MKSIHNKDDNYNNNNNINNNNDTFLEKRLRHFTWAWFTVPMSTGGISLILGLLPFRFKGLDTIGLCFYLADVIFFFTVIAVMILRYTLTSANILDTLRHPIECLFLPTSQLAFATVIMGMSQYSQPHINTWCKDVLLICFWTYTGIATIQAPLQYYALFAIHNQRNNHTTRNITPGILLPIFPSMLVGAVANSVARHFESDQAYKVVLAGLSFQGLGIMITCFFYALLLRKLMQFGLPEPSHRTGLFICAGPPGFCGLALLGMGKIISSNDILPKDLLLFTSYTEVSDILYIMGLVAAIFLWQLAAFWWCLAAISVIGGIRSRKFHFSMSWWATVFPICGVCNSTVLIGQALRSKAILIFATGLAAYLVIAYLVIFSFMIEAVITKKIMWDGHDEDKEIVSKSADELRQNDPLLRMASLAKAEEGVLRETRFESMEAITRVNSIDGKREES